VAIYSGQVAAALVSGNTVLAKPAEQTSLAAAYATRLMLEAGIPSTALQFLPGDGVWDIVFVDPPFSAGLAGQALEQLLAGDALHDDSRVYLETARDDPLTVPIGLDVHRDKVAGEVRYRLLRPSMRDRVQHGV